MTDMKIKEIKEKQLNNISRRTALKKAGIYTALTAAASLIILTPKKAQADSPPGPGWGD